MRFVDCPQCGKRVRSDATSCHRCGALIKIQDDGFEDDGFEDDDFESEHHAEGGYSPDSPDDQDTTEEDWSEQNTTARRLHPVWYVTGWLLVIAFLLPVLLQLIALLRP